MPSSENAFMQLGDPRDVSQVSPFTQPTFNLLTEFLQGSQAGAGQLAQQAIAGFDPTAANRAFLAASPGLQNVTLGATGPLAQSQMSLASQIGLQGINDQAALAAAGGIPLSSSAFAEAASRAAALPQQQALANIVQAQTGLAGQLFGGAQQGLFSGFNLQPQLGLQAAGQQAGLAGAFGGQLASLSGPEFFQPTFVENPNFIGAQDIFGAIAGLGGIGLGSLLGGGLFGGPP